MKFTTEQIEYLESAIVMEGLDITEVKTHIKGGVRGSVLGDVEGNVWGSVKGNVRGNVWEGVWGMSKVVSREQ